MEELRSTEILDKEIQLDARRKAERLLKKADDDCVHIAAEVESRIEKTRAEKRALYAKKIENYNKDADAAIPLEKQRERVLFIDTSVHSALDAYLGALDSEKRFQLLKTLVAQYKDVLSGADVTVSCNGMAVAEAKKLVESVLGKNSVTSCEVSDKAVGCEGLILETADKSIRCRATMNEIRDSMCRNYRFELQDALLGRRLPE